MNVQEMCTVVSPNNKTEECAKFVIDDCTEVFALSDIMTSEREYTFSCWIRSDEAGTITVHGKAFSSTVDWQRFTHTFTADEVDLYIAFVEAGTYYIYHPQLEIGNRATDWTPAPEDVDESIEAVVEVLTDRIRMVVTDSDGQSMMTQTADGGWTFDMTKAVDATAREGVAGLDSRVTGLEPIGDYVKVKTYNGQPCIELGEVDTDFKLRITNTQIQFLDGSSIPAYIANQNGVSKLMIEKAEVKGEFQIGDFVWKKRSNGNVGLMWIGGSD